MGDCPRRLDAVRVHIPFSENRALNSTRSQSVLQDRPEQASFQCVGTDVRIGDRLGINQTSNYECRTLNRAAIVHAALDKIGNRSFGCAAHTFDTPF
jgi:hypothetical protein